MRIAVPIISRGHPLRLVGVIEAMAALSSGEHDIVFGVRWDDDDPLTGAACEALQQHGFSSLFSLSGPRHATLGETWNELMRAMSPAGGPGQRQYDAWVGWNDRIFPMASGWDAKIAEAVTANPRRLLWWRCATEADPTQPVIPAAWWIARGGYVFPELFPFWFIDPWVAEVDELVHGSPMKGMADVVHGGRRGRTKRLRDLPFWFETFEALRPMRLQQAEQLRRVWALPEPDITKIVAALEADANGRRPRWPDLEERFGDKSPPDAQYITTKARAQALMNILKVAA
ncbi:MAG: hypothetical protein Q7S17_07695 [Xanthobacteraceae bacterium]|nr:hypothetical protein [Xanthobacteraceae bacterium]